MCAQLRCFEPEKLHFPCHPGLHIHIYGYLGICFGVCNQITSLLYSMSALLILNRSLSVGLLNGGFGGLFWVFIATVICYSSVVASLAEMESM